MKYLGLLALGAAVFGLSYSYNRRFLDWLRFQSIGTRDYIVEKLNLMFIEFSPNQVLMVLFAMSFGLGGVVFLAFLPQVIPGLLFGAMATVVGWKAPRPLVDFLYQRRVDKFGMQMVDGLSLMSNAMKSGLSVVQSMGVVAQEMPNPMKQEFELVMSENKLGVSLEEAFVNLSKRVRSDDVEMFVTAINILKETGGNLAETFDTITETIRERIKVQNKIKALTAQGKSQGMIVLAVPPIMGFLMMNVDPDFMKPLFSSTLGWILILVVLALELVGFFLIRKIVAIEV